MPIFWDEVAALCCSASRYQLRQGYVKRVAASMPMLVGSYAHADCQDDWLRHRSSTLYLSVEYSQGCCQGERILNVAKFSKSGPRWPSPGLRLDSIPFDRECQSEKKHKDGETIESSCRSDGVSSLAGATYRCKKLKTTIRCNGIDLPDWDNTFVCIKGCGPATPKTLELAHGEGCS